MIFFLGNNGPPSRHPNVIPYSSCLGFRFVVFVFKSFANSRSHPSKRFVMCMHLCNSVARLMEIVFQVYLFLPLPWAQNSFILSIYVYAFTNQQANETVSTQFLCKESFHSLFMTKLTFCMMGFHE